VYVGNTGVCCKHVRKISLKQEKGYEHGSLSADAMLT
jgi:hypothetical protein